MKKIIFVLAILMSTSSFSQVANPATSLPTKHLSMEAKNIGARDAIKSLLDQSGLKYDLPKSLTNTKKVSIQAKDIAWSDVFKMTTAEAGYSYAFDSNNTLQLKPIDRK